MAESRIVELAFGYRVGKDLHGFEGHTADGKGFGFGCSMPDALVILQLWRDKYKLTFDPSVNTLRGVAPPQ